MAKGSHDRDNRQLARIVLEDPDKHGGEESITVRWARLVLGRRAPEPSPASGSSARICSADT